YSASLLDGAVAAWACLGSPVSRAPNSDKGRHPLSCPQPMSAHRNRGPRYVVQGGAVLRGRVCVSGAKNHVLAAMCAALLTDEDVTFSNVPDISDVDTLGELLTSLGAMVERLPGGRLRMNGGGVREFEAPSELITENRASFQVMGPLV